MGVAFPAAVPLGLVGVPGSFRGCRDLLTAAELPEIQVRLGQAPAAFGAPAGQHRGGSEVAGAPGAGQLASSASRSAAAPIWCTREDESLTAAASVRMDTPSARAEGVSSSSRPAARDTRSSTRRSRRHLAVRSAIFMRTACPACAVQQSGHAGGSDDAVLTGTPTTSPTPALRQEIHEGLQVVENSNSANADIFSAKAATSPAPTGSTLPYGAPPTGSLVAVRGPLPRGMPRRPACRRRPAGRAPGSRPCWRPVLERSRPWPGRTAPTDRWIRASLSWHTLMSACR